MENEITRLTNLLAGHIGMSPETVTLLALESYLTKRNGAHLLRVKPEAQPKPARVLKVTPPARIAKGPPEFVIESLTPVPNSIYHTLIVAHKNGERFTAQCSGSDWPGFIEYYAPNGLVKLICYGRRPTKFPMEKGSFPLDFSPLTT